MYRSILYKNKNLLFTLCYLLLLSSCFCPQAYKPSNTPPSLPDCLAVPQPLKVALVLGGGGAKGIAHVGVLEVLEENNIPINLIVGCSAGSIVGAIYADNPDTEDLKDIFLKLKPSYLTDFNVLNARMGLCQGKTLRRFLDAHLTADTFEELKLPFFLVTTDLYSSELITIGGGPIVQAIEASCAFPFMFVPVEIHGRSCVDGGVIDPVPVRVATHFNAEIIIAVDLRGLLPQRFPTNLFGVLMRSAEIMLLWQSEESIRDADIVIRPTLKNCGTFDVDETETVYQAGRVAAEEMVPEIKRLIERNKANSCQKK